MVNYTQKNMKPNGGHKVPVAMEASTAVSVAREAQTIFFIGLVDESSGLLGRHSSHLPGNGGPGSAGDSTSGLGSTRDSDSANFL